LGGYDEVNLPRLVIADEINFETVSPGVTLIYALRRSGVRIKVFTCARSESDLRLLKLLLEDPIISLDLYTCGTVKSLKTLFQRTADPEVLNVILAPLGTRTEENFVQVRPEALELSKVLACGVVVVISASASAILTTNTTLSVLAAFEKAGESCVLGVVFAKVKNPREYQLLEQDYGRRTSTLSLGYIPKEIERPMPTLVELYGAGTSTRVMQVKSAALQLASIVHQIEWEILDAFGHLKQGWIPPQESEYLSKNFKAAVVGARHFSLEGSNGAELFRFLGCDVEDYDPWQDPFPLDAEVIYFPHSIAALYADRLIVHEPFNRGIKESFAANKLIFVNGASALLFGQYLVTPEGQKYEGLKFFPFHGSYASLKERDDVHRIEIRGTGDSIFSKSDEKMRGFSLDYLHISNPGNIVPPVWGYRDIRKASELGTSGWVKGYCFVTDLHLEFWSNVDIVNRWLSLRKR
jgi:cobyrinic acid a,c-diamide synthase